jgi:hypothetical protein
MHAEIAEYKVVTYSRDPAHHQLAAIGLIDTSGSYVGIIYFFREDYDLPAARTSGGVAMHFHISEMPVMLDILRNESPIFLNTTGNTAHLGTATEPIGEGET